MRTVLHAYAASPVPAGVFARLSLTPRFEKRPSDRPMCSKLHRRSVSKAVPDHGRIGNGADLALASGFSREETAWMLDLSETALITAPDASSRDAAV